MTREEAIKVLNGILHLNYRNFWDEECDEAIDIAIKALSEDKTDRMTREEAIADIKNNIKPVVGGKSLDMAIEALSVAELKSNFESADATPTVIRAKTFMRKEDFDKWAQDIKKQNKSVVCIPCDAEVVSADAVVRCKDCIYKCLYDYDDDEPEYYYCALEDRPNRNWSVDDTDYCSWGERREG